MNIPSKDDIELLTKTKEGIDYLYDFINNLNNKKEILIKELDSQKKFFKLMKDVKKS